MSLLQMSFSGAVFILAVIAVRALTLRRLPKKTFSVLWKLAILRLLVPLSLPSVFSVYTYLGSHSSGPKAVLLPAELSAPAFPSPGAPPQTAVPPAAPGTQAGGPSIWLIIWCAGMAICSIFFLASYFACRKNFKTALPVRNGYVEEWQTAQKRRRRVAVRQLDGISSPLTYGIWKPVILLPKSTDWEDTETLKFILTHEYAHILRMDALTKLALTAALCIHWFNPAVWIMFPLFNRDIELACDEEVLRRLGDASKAPYALALIGMEERKSNPTLLYNNFSKNSVEERIRSIMKHKKFTKSAVVIAMILVFGLTAAFATSPARAKGGAESTGENASAGFDEENEKFELKIEKSFEVQLAPGEEIELETIQTKQGQVIIVTQQCEGVQKVGIRLDGDRLTSGEIRVEKVGVFTSECIHEEEERKLVVYNPGSSDIDVTIGYCVMEGEEYNRLGTWDLLNCLKRECGK